MAMAMTSAVHLPVRGMSMVDSSSRCSLGFTSASISISCKKKSPFRLRVAAAKASSSTLEAAQEEEQQAFVTPPLKEKYFSKVVPILQQEFKYTNKMQMPKIIKVVVNCGIGDANQNAKALESSMKDIALITGQRPCKTRAKKSIANFKIREGVPLGLAVTLRGNLMWNFLDRLINLAFPRTRDFEGVNPNSFDGHGNYSVGIKEQFVFPEIVYETKVGGILETSNPSRDERAGSYSGTRGIQCRAAIEDDLRRL
ncbi:hypothetical protein SUGI_0043790 [Cryptomeria japonica]|nr:hypothetical protein SUGI_0043790 [Cryptomeria japonica]